MTASPRIYLVTGSTGAGKTTASLKLVEETGALHFSIDEWMVTLFGADRPDPIEFEWMMERIGRCETLIWSMAERAARQGTSSILDLGFTKSSHRQKFADLARDAGLPVRLCFVDVPADERWKRVQGRNAEQGETYAMEVTREMFDFMENMWEPPGEAEMAALDGVRLD